ncbi:39S ribosomal protein L4 [Babesia caballi]|uniref:39S ribosomal protein L4 n=1 Tax=Babesia caballi TaxID=5871 RepID=A0AAV4LYC1_BABCB|nr:39S ribosomal protein L4 [Babesia caballi]
MQVRYNIRGSHTSLLHVLHAAKVHARRGQVGPEEAVPQGHGDGAQGGAEDDLHAHVLALVVHGVARPRDEAHNVLGHLGDRGWGPVLVVDHAVLQRRRHGDGAAREVVVEIEALTQLNPLWGVTVASKQREQVVGAGLAGGGHEREVGGNGAAVGEARGLGVGVGRWERVGQNAGPHVHLPLVVGAVLNLVLLGDLLGALLRVHFVGEVAEPQVLHGVASGADLAIDLVAPADAADVVAVEGALEPEGVVGRPGRVDVGTPGNRPTLVPVVQHGCAQRDVDVGLQALVAVLGAVLVLVLGVGFEEVGQALLGARGG